MLASKIGAFDAYDQHPAPAHDRDNEIRGNSHKVSFDRKLSKTSTTPLPALSLSFFIE